MPVDIPKTMKRLVVTKTDPELSKCVLTVEETKVPTPKSGQVLVKVTAAAVNPSDYGSWTRAAEKYLPMAVGKEGCGIIVASGGGLLSTFSAGVGTAVGFVNLPNYQGAYAEYVVADALHVYALPADLNVADAASFFVNPYTAVGILDTAPKALIHTAAASQLGQMMVQLAPKLGKTVVNVVRRKEQIDLLTKLGAEHVICTADADWKEQLSNKIDELGITTAFDAVAGPMAGELLTLLPKGGTCYVYGALAGKVSQIDPMDLIYKQKHLKGFYLVEWIQAGGILATLPRIRHATSLVMEGLKDGWSASQFQDTTLEKMHYDLLELMSSGATGKKLRVRLE